MSPVSTSATPALKDMLKDDTMSLEDKLKAIDAAMANAQASAKSTSSAAAPFDPADLTICDSCQ